jgi:dTDP-glucose 4,6-dehydratase
MRYLVTGGAGFIGCNYVRQLLATNPDCEVRVFDKLTYAGSRDNLALAGVLGDPRVQFLAGDICDPAAVDFALQDMDLVVHFAAETHVDRSIHSAAAAVRTNVEGTFRLLEACRDRNLHRFIHVATDEVYGSSSSERFTEESVLKPRNPYSASKAGGDRLAYSYFVTYGLPVIITRPTNTYGPYQYPEKLIPLFVLRALRDEHLPVYGSGNQVRDWLHVDDHCRAVDVLIEQGQVGEVYNIVGGNERENMQVIRLILQELGKPESLIKHVEDRPGHDIRYPLADDKIKALGWRSETPWEQGMRATIRWFADHREWLERSLDRGREFMEAWYRER